MKNNGMNKKRYQIKWHMDKNSQIESKNRYSNYFSDAISRYFIFFLNLNSFASTTKLNW